MSKKFYIASGYKGIKNNMCLEINNRLSVITGLNGAGKTSILKYLYSMHTDKEQVFFKTQNHEDQNQHRWLHRRSSKGFENIMEEIHRRFSKRFTPLSYIDECDMYQILFDAQSCLSEQANSILEDISEFLLSELNVDEQDVKKPLGVPTGADLEKYYKQEIKRIIKVEPQSFRWKQPKSIYDKYLAGLLSDNERDRIKSISKKVTDMATNTCRSKGKIKDRDSFEKYVYDLISENNVNLDSIIDRISKKIHDDCRAKINKTKTEKLWESINGELMKYESFRYKIAKPALLYPSKSEINFESKVGGNVE